MNDDLARAVRASRLVTAFPQKYEIIHFIDDHDAPPSTPPRQEHWKTEKRAFGRGGQGQVFLQTCITGGRFHTQRAVKKIPIVKEGGGKKRYERELRAITRFSHASFSRYFVQSLGWYETKRSLCITMEYLEDGDLHTYLDSVGTPMPEQDCCHIIRQVLQSLVVMHSEGFNHGDIKPRNVLIKQRAAEGEPHTWWVKLADFGISKRAMDIGGTTTLVGTPEYMAPELKPDTAPEDLPAADIWAVGIMTFHILTLEAVFQPAWRIGLYCESPDKLFPRTALVRQNVSVDGQGFIRRLMEPTAEQRPSSIRALDEIWVQTGTPETYQTETNYDSDSSDTSSAVSSQVSARSDERGLTTQLSIVSSNSTTAMMPVEGQLLQALNAVSLHGPTAGSLSTTGTGLTGSKSTAELMREMKSLAASLGISWADMEAVVQKRQQSSALPSDGATMSKEVEMALDDKQGTVIFKEPTTMSQDPASIRSADMVKAAATFDLQPLPPSREDTAKDPRTILGRIKNKKRVMISPMSAQERQEAVSANWLIHGYMPFLPKVIRAGDRARALTMIEHGMVDLEEQGWTGQTALAFAAEEGQVSIARALIEAGALLDSTSDDGKTPLIWAAALADTSMVKLLLDHGANIEHRSRLGQTPLSWAATNGKTYVMHELLNRGADIEAKSNDGKSPLSWAAIYGMTEAVKLLVLKGANIESQSNNMQTPLLWSMEKGHERTTDLLLKLGANLDSEKRLGTTSIFLALEEGNSSVFNKLLDRFPYMIEERNQILQTPLGWAAERSDDKTVKELLERGADLEARSNNGQTPLSRAVTYGSLSTAQMLVEKGAFVESKSYNGQTPLSWAAMYGRKEMVQFLLSQRARVNTLSRNGQSPRDWAVEKGQDEVVKLLYIA